MHCVLEANRVTAGPERPASERKATRTAADRSVGAFSDNPPWLIRPEELTWRVGLSSIRSVARRQVPALIAPRRWPGLRAVRVVRLIGGAGATWWLRERRGPKSASRTAISRRMRIAAEELGPTYIKLGQIISSGQGIFPAELVDEFKKCRDQVPPESYETVRRVIEEDFGMALHDVFTDFDPTPLASASIAQVHRARVRPEFVAPFVGDGPVPTEPVEVVVKVQRPQVARLVHEDVRAMSWLAPRLVGRIPVAALANPPALVELFAETIVEELDFCLEAQNMLDIARVLAETDQRATIVPRPHPTLVTRRVLVMERLDGIPWDDVVAMKQAGVDTEAVLHAGLVSFMEGAMLYGVFHGDLHGGNLMVTPDGRTVLMDFGITGRLDETKRLAFLMLLVGATSGDTMGQLRALRDLGAFPPDTDLKAVFSDLGLDRTIDPTLLSADELVHELQDLTKKLLEYGARAPKELMLFVKNMMFLDGAIARLAPDLDILEEVQRVHTEIAARHGVRLAQELGIDPALAAQFDMDAVKAAMGVPDVDKLTYREVQERREIIRQRLEQKRKRA